MCEMYKYFCNSCEDFIEDEDADDFRFCEDSDFCPLIHVKYYYYDSCFRCSN